MMVADVLAPNRYQAIINHYADLTVREVSFECYVLYISLWSHYTKPTTRGRKCVASRVAIGAFPQRKLSMRCSCNFKCAILKFALWRGNSREIPPRWTSCDINGKSTLVQKMAWVRKAAIHYPNHCWLTLRPITPCGLNMDQLVNIHVCTYRPNSNTLSYQRVILSPILFFFALFLISISRRDNVLQFSKNDL